MIIARTEGFVALIALIVLGASSVSSVSATSDPATLLAATRALITFNGPAAFSNTISISEEMQIQPLKEDFGLGQPLGWAVDISNESQTFHAEIAWNWTKGAGAAFAYSLVEGQQTSANAGSANCFDGKGYCTSNVSDWNFSDPFRWTFGSDKTLGAGWWSASIIDLATGALLDLGSVKRTVTTNFSNLTVKAQIYRPTLADDCPSDAAPTGDTYFGPIVDTNGGEDVAPLGGLEKNKCANAELGTLINSAGAYVLYGGTKAAIALSPRSDSFSPSSLIASSAFPIPDSPTQFSSVVAGGLLSLSVKVPHLNSQGIKAVFLVSPELGHPETNPLYAFLIGTSAHLQIPITHALLERTISISLYTQTGFVISDPLQEVVTIPKNAIQSPSGSHAIPKGSFPAPTLLTSTPKAPTGLKVSVTGNLLTLTATSNQKPWSAANGAYLIAPLINGNSLKPITLATSGSIISFNLQLNPTLQNKVFRFSIYLSNKIGKSKEVTGSYKIP